jgi:hypothetical protein
MATEFLPLAANGRHSHRRAGTGWIVNRRWTQMDADGGCLDVAWVQLTYSAKLVVWVVEAPFPFFTTEAPARPSRNQTVGLKVEG